MKKITYALLISLALLPVALIGQAGQNVLNNTTLASAVTTTTTNTIVVTSTSEFTSFAQDMAVGQELFVDQEAMLIRAISGTTLTVTRGYDGTVAQTHATSTRIFSGPTNFYQNTDPPNGSCTVTSVAAIPWINVKNGNVWLCRSSLWQATNAVNITYNSVNAY